MSVGWRMKERMISGFGIQDSGFRGCKRRAGGVREWRGEGVKG
jgi:hypothetical protein